jgi:PLP dependent protein
MIAENLLKLKNEIPAEVGLVAVSKFKSEEAILEAYEAGQRLFGENYVQELTDKYQKLPQDISWHFIGHLQSNKVKYIAPFVDLIQSVDSLKLLKEINKEGAKNNRVINCLLQVFIASESTKEGLNEDELAEILEKQADFQFVTIIGLMGMASFTSDTAQVKSEFEVLNSLFLKHKTVYQKLSVLSMGMSGDYQLAIACGSNLIRVGTKIFGQR